MKPANVIAVMCVVFGGQVLAADSVDLQVQYSSVSVSATIYRATGNGYNEPVVTRTAGDNSQAIGSRTALVDAAAASGGVGQTSSGLLEIEVTRQPEVTTVTAASGFSTSFQQDPDASIRSGSTWTEIRSDQNFRFVLDRPHNVTVSLVPTGGQTLAGNGSVSVNSYASGEYSSMNINLGESGERTLSLRMAPGEHEIISSATSSGFGSFNADNGEYFLLDGDVGMTVTIEMVAIGQAPVVSGSIKLLRPVGDRISLVLSGLQPGRNYEVDRTISLTNPQWSFVRSFYAASSGATIVETFDPNAPSSFYRLRQTP